MQRCGFPKAKHNTRIFPFLYYFDFLGGLNWVVTRAICTLLPVVASTYSSVLICKIYQIWWIYAANLPVVAYMFFCCSSWCARIQVCQSAKSIRFGRFMPLICPLWRTRFLLLVVVCVFLGDCPRGRGGEMGCYGEMGSDVARWSLLGGDGQPQGLPLLYHGEGGRCAFRRWGAPHILLCAYYLWMGGDTYWFKSRIFRRLDWDWMLYVRRFGY